MYKLLLLKLHPLSIGKHNKMVSSCESQVDWTGGGGSVWGNPNPREWSENADQNPKPPRVLDDNFAPPSRVWVNHTDPPPRVQFLSKTPIKLDSGEEGSWLQTPDPLHQNEAYALIAKISLEGTSGISEYWVHSCKYHFYYSDGRERG